MGMSSIRNRRPTKVGAVEDILDLVRAQMAAAIESGDARTIDASALLIAGVARREAERDGDMPHLRQWHALLLDAAAGVRGLSSDVGQVLTAAADAVRRTISLAARNPADQLAIRPTSRRVLLALHELGGVGCSMTEVREKAEQSPTHFSNVLRPLRSAGLVTSEAFADCGRARRHCRAGTQTHG
jgi:DNA-binding transcriptional ArsR family regulator